MSGVERIAERFARVRERRDMAMIPYFVAGYPSLRATREYLWQAYEAGVNLIELGIPFSDPVADGPSIAHASHHALKSGVTPKKVLGLVASMRREGLDTPILGMTYANLLFHRGWAKSATAWSQAGLDGAIIPDVSLDDSDEYRAAFRKKGLATVLFASPGTEGKRLERAVRSTTGFLYLVGVYGTTGARSEVQPETFDILRRARRARNGARPPVCVGFGISRPGQIHVLHRAKADGIIVGSAIVDAIDNGASVRGLLRNLKRATLPEP